MCDNNAKKLFRRVGFALFALIAVTALLQIVMSNAVYALWPDIYSGSWFLWVLSAFPMYCVGVPLCWVVMLDAPKSAPEKNPFGVGRFITTLLICFFLMYAGNLLGAGVNAGISAIFGIEVTNPLEEMIDGSSMFLEVLITVVLAPVFEELIFRKLMIDRTRVYGERLAVVLSALLFGLFHGNFSQFFYAFALGLVFGYVYVRTGKYGITLGLHMIINLVGGIISSVLAENVDLTLFDTGDASQLLSVLSQPAYILYMLYCLGLITASLAGLVFFIIRVRKVHFEPAPSELPKKGRFKTVYLNAGMLLAILACLAEFVMNLFFA